MKSSWETVKSGTTHYIEVTPTHVCVGEHRGTTYSDMAGSCTLDEFLAGRWHDLIRSDHGPAVFAEVLEAVRALPLPTDPVAPLIQSIPADPQLPILLAHPSTAHGRNFYGNGGGYKTTVPSSSVTCHFDSVRGYVQGPDGKRNFTLPGHGSSATAWHDLFCIVVNGTIVTVDAAARVATYPNLPFSPDFRVTDCSRHPDTWILTCHRRHTRHSDFLFGFHPASGLTSRFEQTIG